MADVKTLIKKWEERTQAASPPPTRRSDRLSDPVEEKEQLRASDPLVDPLRVVEEKGAEPAEKEAVLSEKGPATNKEEKSAVIFTPEEKQAITEQKEEKGSASFTPEEKVAMTEGTKDEKGTPPTEKEEKGVVYFTPDEKEALAEGATMKDVVDARVIKEREARRAAEIEKLEPGEYTPEEKERIMKGADEKAVLATRPAPSAAREEKTA